MRKVEVEMEIEMEKTLSVGGISLLSLALLPVGIPLEASPCYLVLVSSVIPT